jgi:hypothetical protein
VYRPPPWVDGEVEDETMSDEKKKPTLTAADVEGHHQSANMHDHRSGVLRYTDRVKVVAVKGHAWWLVDAVASYQANPLVRQELFQAWTLTRGASGNLVLEMRADDSDGINRTPIIRQYIEGRDFALDIIEMYVTDGILQLAAEY